MTTANRKPIRTALATVLRNEVSGVQQVYRYQKARLKGQTPVICVTSASSDRQPLTMQGNGGVFEIDIHIFVLYSDGATWVEEQAEDRLDDLEQQIGEVVERYRKSTSWDRLVYAGPSDARRPVTLEGNTYLHEVIPVTIQAYKEQQ